MSRNILIALCLVAGVAVSLGNPTVVKREAEEPVPNQPKITYSKETVSSEGEEVRIDCSVEGVDLSGVDGFGVSWSKLDEDDPIKSYPISSNEKVLLFTDRFSIYHPEGSYQYTLIIKEINEEDIGLYRCTVNFGEGQKINADVPVRIEKAPYFTDNLTKTLTVTEGDAISIDCQPGGIPKPDVYWERLEQELPYYGGKFFKANQFDIPLIERDHEGHYVCYADNRIGNPASSHIILEVQFAPLIKVDNEQVFATTSDSLSMTCNVEAHPVADVGWYKDGIAILGGANKKLNNENIKEEDGERTIGIKSTLTLPEVAADDFGTYTCKAVNTIGKTERTVEVRLKSPPRIINQSRKEVLYDLVKSNLRDALPVVIECEADGAPSPNFRWTKDGEPLVILADPRFDLEPGTGNLLVTDPTMDDNGFYQCFAYNELGTATSDPVYLLNSTSISFSNDEDSKDTYDVTAELGRPFQLACPNATAYPKPTMRWVKAIEGEDQIQLEFVNDERIVADPYGSIWFTHVTSDDATTNFQYMCLGSTEFEPADFSIASIINLSVVPPADGEHNSEHDSLNVESFEMFTSPEEVTFMALEENTLWCIFGGEPAPAVNWRRIDGADIDESRFVTRNFGRTLVFKNTQLSDAGKYECISSNGVGEPKTSTMTVMVEQAPTFMGDMASQTVTEGSEVTFTCQVEGTGDVTFNWMFNGRPISPEATHPRRALSSSMLIIRDVSMVDIGNYACNATSELGHAYGQATLNVIPGEHRVTNAKSEEIAKLHNEIADLRDAIQKIHDMVVEQLDISKHNHEKLHEIGDMLPKPATLKDDTQMVEEKKDEMVDKTADEQMMMEGDNMEEATTESFFNP